MFRFGEISPKYCGGTKQTETVVGTATATGTAAAVGTVTTVGAAAAVASFLIPLEMLLLLLKLLLLWSCCCCWHCTVQTATDIGAAVWLHNGTLQNGNVTNLYEL
jgi:hypothetical protein